MTQSRDVVVVTALFDIERQRYDRSTHPLTLRSMDDYYGAFRTTLRLNAPMVVYTEEKSRGFVERHRPRGLHTEIVVRKLEELFYHRYRDAIAAIIESPGFRSVCDGPERIEYVLPEYNVIGFSKFEWMRDAVERNPFASSYFMWLDAGASRFFQDVDIDRPWPGREARKTLLRDDRLLIQTMEFIDRVGPGDFERLFGSCPNWIMGTLFGGRRDVILRMADDMRELFFEALRRGTFNTEQTAILLCYARNMGMFRCHPNPHWRTGARWLELFKVLAA